MRPSIIGAAHKNPIEGWIEGVTAISALVLLSGVGAIKDMYSVFNNVGDVIPVDYVSDCCITCGAFYANKSQTNVIHCSTSYLNPL